MPDLDSTGLSGDETAPTLTRSTRIWFEDGNVVLRAQNTVFRVYKGILSRDSSVFRYMFSLPNLENAETYDVSGCPLVVVQDDAADMELYLTLIFDPNSLDVQCSLRDTIMIFDKACKYQTAGRLLRRTMSILEHYCPSTLAGFDHFYDTTDPTCLGGFAVGEFHEDHVTDDILTLMVQVARRTGMSILLPAAFLCAGTRSIDTLVSDKYEDWARGDLGVLLVGLRRLYTAGRTVVWPALYSARRDIADGCKAPVLCHDARHAFIRWLESDPCGTIIDVFITMESKTPRALAGKLCTSCRAVLVESYMKGRAQAWNDLPSTFGLPAWLELGKARDDILSEA